MLFLTRPTDEVIRAIFAKQEGRQFSYEEVGASKGRLPSGYKILHHRAMLGRGSSQFERASEALSHWEMFNVPGISLCWPATPIQVGNLVAILIKHFGFWSLNFCRIAYVIDEENPVRRFGFAYGTLAEHAEKGEERFTVEWDPTTDEVSYDILSFSRSGNWKTTIAYPLARWLQRHFVRNSLIAMVRAVKQVRIAGP
jgi:uncharacterized protein (UPF0548 family)